MRPIDSRKSVSPVKTLSTPARTAPHGRGMAGGAEDAQRGRCRNGSPLRHPGRGPTGGIAPIFTPKTAPLVAAFSSRNRSFDERAKGMP